MQCLEDDTTGPKKYYSPIGKKFQNCELYTVINRQKISTAVLSVNKTDKNTEKNIYLHGNCTAETNDFCPEDLYH